MDAARRRGSARGGLSCTNLAHGFAASDATDKEALKLMRWPNVAIVSAYNDMLSAHQPLEPYPALIKRAARAAGAVAQFAGGVPAMCDGVTQGQHGMELSLFSRDVIAMATGVALAHNMFDSALCLGICDKIVPGMLMGDLAFGHLPVIFVPAGPMPSGVPNKEKARIRQLYAEGRVGRDALLESEAASYHGAGTCTFYGTANSNQMLMEVMGLHMPGAAFVGPGTRLRQALTRAAVHRLAAIGSGRPPHPPPGPPVHQQAHLNPAPGLDGDVLRWTDAPARSRDETMLRPASAPFSPDGGMRLLTGNLGRAIVKTSAVAGAHLTIEAPARVFTDQDAVQAAFKAGEL